MTRDDVSVARLVGVLGAFLVAGGGILVYVWRALNRLLTGQPPDRSLWIALVLVLVFLVLLRVLKDWIRGLGGSEG